MEVAFEVRMEREVEWLERVMKVGVVPFWRERVELSANHLCF